MSMVAIAFQIQNCSDCSKRCHGERSRYLSFINMKQEDLKATQTPNTTNGYHVISCPKVVDRRTGRLLVFVWLGVIRLQALNAQEGKEWMYVF